MSVDAEPRAAPAPTPEVPTLGQATRVWAKIGVLGFGGPAGQIALMHKELVERRRWLDEERFLHALNYCMLLPGPEATQLATYIGWLMHKTRGGLVAGVLFVLPGFVAILGLSLLYAGLHAVPAVSALFYGLKAAVLAVVVEAALRIGRRALKTRLMLLVAALAFVAIFAFAVPFPALVATAGVVGLVVGRLRPELFPRPPVIAAVGSHDTVVDVLAARGDLAHTRPSAARAVRVVVVCGLLWAAPLAVLLLLHGPDGVLVQEGLFFSKTAVVTFGGAYAVLAYIAQRAVQGYHWLGPGQMLDGLGLAETTPGPLIMVVQFVGFLGAAANPPAGVDPMVAGVLGSLVTVWVTFVPCFLWIFLGAPYIEALRGNRALWTALSTITAAVVGVILDLSLWFALHVLFKGVATVDAGPIHVIVPDLASLDPAALVLCVAALAAMLWLKLGMGKTLAAAALLGAAWKLGPGA
ncbi:MAG: chromate efflux transporter [Myxococcota bacterium]